MKIIISIIYMIVATISVSANADSIMIQRGSNGAIVFNFVPLPAVNDAPLKLTNKQIRDYVAYCSKNEIVTKASTTEQSVVISQPIKDDLLIVLKMEELERMDTVKNDDCSYQMPTIAVQTSRQQITLRTGETLLIPAFDGETYTITRVASKN